MIRPNLLRERTGVQMATMLVSDNHVPLMLLGVALPLDSTPGLEPLRPHRCVTCTSETSSHSHRAFTATLSSSLGHNFHPRFEFSGSRRLLCSLYSGNVRDSGFASARFLCDAPLCYLDAEFLFQSPLCLCFPFATVSHRLASWPDSDSHLTDVSGFHAWVIVV